jgi:hypothetical protein
MLSPLTPDPTGSEKSARGTLKADVDQYNQAESSGEERVQLLQRLAGIERSVEELEAAGWQEDFSRLRGELSRERARLKFGQTGAAPGQLAQEARQFRLRPAPPQAQSTSPPRAAVPVSRPVPSSPSSPPPVDTRRLDRPVPSRPPRPADASGQRPPQPTAHPPILGGGRPSGMGPQSQAPATAPSPSSARPDRLPPLSPQHQADVRSLATVDLDAIKSTWGVKTDEEAMEMAYAWSETKHRGRGPEQGPGTEPHSFEIHGSTSNVQYRVYLNTTQSGTQAVSDWLRKELPSAGHKQSSPGWAADRRDAIVIYVRPDPGLQAVLDAVRAYQSDPRRKAHFVDELVRLTRPVPGLRGVGVADEPLNISKSFSQVASGAVLNARRAAEAEGGTTGVLPGLGRALLEAGRQPHDPSREQYSVTVDGRQILLPEREATGEQILQAAGMRSNDRDLYDADNPFNPTRVQPDQVVFLARGKKFLTVEPGTAPPKQKPPIPSLRGKG